MDAVFLMPKDSEQNIIIKSGDTYNEQLMRIETDKFLLIGSDKVYALIYPEHVITPDSVVKIDMTIVQGDDGIVSLKFSDEDYEKLVVGKYVLEVVIETADNGTSILPTNGYLYLEIKPSYRPATPVDPPITE